MFEKDGLIKTNIKKATYRINFCREETKKAIPKLIKKFPEGVVLDEENRKFNQGVSSQYLRMLEQLNKSQSETFSFGLYSSVFKKVLFSHP